MSVIKGFNILNTNKQLETCLMPVAKAGDRETEIKRKIMFPHICKIIQSYLNFSLKKKKKKKKNYEKTEKKSERRK